VTKLKIHFLLSVLFISGNAFAESGKNVFIIDSIHEIRLTFDQPNFWDTLIHEYDIKHGETEESVTPIIASMTFDGKELDSIGVKLKSNFSYSIPTSKKPIKLDFNAFVKGQRFDSLTALNLSNEFPDHSMLRNTVAYKILREAGVVAPRTSFAKVWLNEKYQGLYVLIEQVDKAFITDHFHRAGAELVKATSSPLYYQDLDTMSYYRNFEIKVKDQPASWARLIDFGRSVNKTTAKNFIDSIGPIFDLHGYIKVLAADILFNNWDSYFYGQNYYLLWDSVKAKYFFIPWDYNLALNAYEVSGGNFDILPGGDEQHLFSLPLPVKVFENPALRKEYLDQLRSMNELMLSQINFITAMHKKLRPALASDNGKVFTILQYDNGLTQDADISEIPMKGLVKFIRDRNAQVKNLLLQIKK
jgi:spore coat protein CotH